MSGRGVSVPTDRLVSMSPEDAKPLLGIGWTTQNNLEIEAHVPRLKFGLIA
jgi:hypothetical protein